MIHPADFICQDFRKDLASHIGKVGTVTASSLNVRSGAKVERDIVAKVEDIIYNNRG